MKILEPLKKLSVPKWSFPKLHIPTIKKTKNYLALHVGKSFIRLLGLGEDGQPLFPPYETIIEDGDHNKKVLALKDVVEKYGLRGYEVISALPVAEAILKLYKYPSTISQKDLKEAIDWVIKKEMSQIREETLHDHFILHGDKVLNVALVMARAESVNRLTNLIVSAGLKPAIVDYEVLAIVNYGIYHNLALPFSVLYIDYDYSILVTYSLSNISYSPIEWGYLEYTKNTGSYYSQELLEHFLAEVRNSIVINDIFNVYIAGVVLKDEVLVEYLLENIPILGLLDAGDLPPNFFVPYVLSLREMS